jgi:hypothetical protein
MSAGFPPVGMKSLFRIVRFALSVDPTAPGHWRTTRDG